MEILFEDSEIIVIVKPAGMASQLSQNGEDCVTALRARTGKEVFPVHRLDTAAGGVMVYALTKRAAAFLFKEMSEGRFQKEYCVAAHGCPEPSSGVMEDWLFKDRGNKSYVVARQRKGVKRASLSYALVRTLQTERFGTVSIVEVRLHTGRTHQIRVQFASRRLPLLGDGKYGARDNAPFMGLACRRLTFRHPATGETVSFSREPWFLPALLGAAAHPAGD